MRGPKLAQLKLANNKLTSLPSRLSSLVGLNTVVLDNNALPALPDVRYCACPLTALPRACRLLHGRSWVLAHGASVHAPATLILHAPALSNVLFTPGCFHAECCHVCAAQALMALPGLSIVMASCNQIRVLPEEIGNATQLQALVLQSNEITVRCALLLGRWPGAPVMGWPP
jgi:Leucine-rich repeat (LRR) protein